MGNGRVALLCPSRGRAESLKRLLESFTDTTSGKADIFVRNGVTDVELASYEGINHPNLTKFLGSDADFGHWPNAGYCFAMQDLWVRYPGYSIYTCMEDDFSFTEKEWDQKLLDAVSIFPNRVGLVGWQVNGRSTTLLAASDTWCEALGYFQKPHLQEAAYDGLHALGAAVDRIAKGPQIYHHSTVTRWTHMAPIWAKDVSLMHEWIKSPDFEEDIQKLKRASNV